MSARSSEKRVFALFSCVSLAGAVALLAPRALADECLPDEVEVTKYKGPPPAACTDSDIQAFEDALKDPATKSIVDVEKAVKAKSASCAACIFTKVDSPARGPLLVVGDKAAINPDGCYERAPGGSAACAAARVQRISCYEEHCVGCVEEGAKDPQGDFEACIDLVDEDGLCDQYDFQTACGASLSALNALCGKGDIIQLAQIVCGGVAAPDPDPGSSSGGSDPADDDPDPDDGASSSGGASSGGSKKKKKKSSDPSAPAADPAPLESSGCAQAHGSAGGSLASALVLAAAVGAAITRRRRPR